MIYFNPRGLRRPRRPLAGITRVLLEISIHEVFADLDADFLSHPVRLADFNPRGLRRPRPDQVVGGNRGIQISIHEVFADLDLNRLYDSTAFLMISIHEVFADLVD